MSRAVIGEVIVDRRVITGGVVVGITVDTDNARLAAIVAGGARPPWPADFNPKSWYPGAAIIYAEVDKDWTSGDGTDPATGKWKTEAQIDSAVYPVHTVPVDVNASQVGVSLPAGRVIYICSPMGQLILDRNVGSWPTGPMG